jgi:uncharacterized protein (TIGR02611 family)
MGMEPKAGVELAKFFRQAAVLVGGSLLLAVGVAMLVLPGPGLAVILAGLGVLSTEYAWARRWLDRGRSVIAGVRSRIAPLGARMRAVAWSRAAA